MNEWSWVGIKLNGSKTKKVPNFSIFISRRKFHQDSSHCSLSESSSRSSAMYLYPEIPKNTESCVSTNHSPCWQKMEPLRIGYPSIHSKTITSLNSTGVRKSLGNLQAPLVFLGILIHSFHTETGLISVTPPL